MVHLIDLSHEVGDGVVTYPGLPAPVVCDFLSREKSRSHYSDGTTFQIARIDLVANTGTYVDSPFHRFEDGIDLADLDLAEPPASDFRFHVVPVKFRGIGTFPVRAYAVVDDAAGIALRLLRTHFSRRCIADQFIRQATLPSYERSTRGAQTVVRSWMGRLGCRS